MRRTGKQGLHERVIKMDLKDLVNELEEKETKESAAELCARLGFEEPSEEQKRQNLNDNLDYFFSQVK